MAYDNFTFPAGVNNSSSSPARSAAAVTPHDTNELSATAKGLYVGTGGTVSVILADDTVAVSFVVGDGALLPIRARIVRVTGTTASNIVALF